jgi:hypothetical protein
MTTYLIQLLLPLYDNRGDAFPPERFAEVRDELVARFGGLTAHTRSPARGLWQQEHGRTVRDDVVIYEVMAEALDERWWRDYRAILERRFAQDALVVRAQQIRML